MNVLIGCECTGTIRDAFRECGHNAFSCDLLPDQKGNNEFHIQKDILAVLRSEHYPQWDLFIVHPDCTYLTISAEWAYADKPMIKGVPRRMKKGTLIGAKRRGARKEALQFVALLFHFSRKIKRVCLENPIGKINTEIRKPTQYIQPHEYGHDASKKTGLWLRGLPELEPTEHIAPRFVNGLPRWGNQTDSGQNKLGPSEDRWLKRATTYLGWADAFAEQWG